MKQLTDTEITEMLTKIFAKPAVPESAESLPQEMLDVIAAFERVTESQLEYPVVILAQTSDHTGRINFSEYDERVITIARTYKPWDWEPIYRNNQQMARSLAHELGHIIHLRDGIHYGFDEENFGWCEDFADWWRDQLLEMAGL